VRFPRVYAIVDEDAAARVDIDPVSLAQAFLRGGVRFLQLRAKRSGSAAVLRWAQAIAALARAHAADFVVNDRADIARLAAAGVHVGQDDLSPAEARAIVGPDAIVGVSTHTREQIAGAASMPVSYVAVGPVFGTATKDTGYDAVGVDLVRFAVGRIGGVPVVAIGGITLERAPAALEAGATSVAIISDLVVHGDAESRARRLVAALGPSRGV
jgi:thiamine-phosphate pyrophosphorylase